MVNLKTVTYQFEIENESNNLPDLKQVFKASQFLQRVRKITQK